MTTRLVCENRKPRNNLTPPRSPAKQWHDRRLFATPSSRLWHRPSLHCRARERAFMGAGRRTVVGDYDSVASRHQFLLALACSGDPIHPFLPPVRGDVWRSPRSFCAAHSSRTACIGNSSRSPSSRVNVLAISCKAHTRLTMSGSPVKVAALARISFASQQRQGVKRCNWTAWSKATPSASSSALKG